MVTVSYTGDPPPDTGVNIFQALRGLAGPVRGGGAGERDLPGRAERAADAGQDTAQMAGSQQQATAAALTALHIAYATTVS